MKDRERENMTLSFQRPIDRGAVEETFYPWNLTIERWKNEGLPNELVDKMVNANGKKIGPEDHYFNCLIADGCYNFEKYLGFDGVKRVFFALPFKNYETKIIEETDEFLIRQDHDGWQRKYYKNRDFVEEIKPLISDEPDWERAKERAISQIEQYYTDEIIKEIYEPYKEGHQNGDYSIRLCIDGFFWAPRIFLGIEKHLLAFYDYPEMMHDINEFILNLYLDKLGKVLDILPADIVYIMEDLSGANGPMISPGLFDEFVGDYYKRLVPFLKTKGVKHIFVDTDGDFNTLIPNFIQAGIEGFLPMDVNAGMDIVEVRKKYPKLKFIGAFNKLEIAKGKEAIDCEFERLRPIIRQGGYIPGCDHQVAPSTSLENYIYYIKKLKEMMTESGMESM